MNTNDYMQKQRDQRQAVQELYKLRESLYTGPDSGYTDTESAIAMLMTESTGTHFLDSGFAVGRAWQQNQGRDFKGEPVATLDSRYGFSYSRSFFHFITERAKVSDRDKIAEWYSGISEDSHFADVQIVSELIALFDMLESECDSDEPGDLAGYDLAKWHMLQILKNKIDDTTPTTESIEWLAGWYEVESGVLDVPDLIKIARDLAFQLDAEPKPPYYANEPACDNTANYDTTLSDNFQFLVFTSEWNQYVILQYHGGADVRGGYTRGIVLESSGYADITESIQDYASGRVSCDDSECGASWYTDDSYHWKNDAPPSNKARFNRFDSSVDTIEFEIEPISIDDSPAWRTPDGLPLTESEIAAKIAALQESHPDSLIIDHNGRFVCPVCASGRLEPH